MHLQILKPFAVLAIAAALHCGPAAATWDDGAIVDFGGQSHEGWSGMAAKPDAPAADGARDVAARHIRDRAQGESNRNGLDAARKHEICDTVLRSRAGVISQWQTGDARADASISARSRSE